MPFCPKCKSEYISGITICADCDIELVEELLEDEHFPSEFYSLIYTTGNSIEAVMLKDNLDSAGITAYILNQQDRNYQGTNNINLIKVYVASSDASDALEYVESLKNTEINLSLDEENEQE